MSDLRKDAKINMTEHRKILSAVTERKTEQLELQLEIYKEHIKRFGPDELPTKYDAYIIDLMEAELERRIK